MVYVVVAVRLTDLVPLVAVEVVQPLGLVAEQEVAFVELQVSVELLPELTVVRLAESVTVGAGVLDPEPEPIRYTPVSVPSEAAFLPADEVDASK